MDLQFQEDGLDEMSLTEIAQILAEEGRSFLSIYIRTLHSKLKQDNERDIAAAKYREANSSNSFKKRNPR